MRGTQDQSAGSLPAAPELIKMNEAGQSHAEIAERYGTTRQAVSAKINRYLKNSDPSIPLLPWRVKDSHRHRSRIVSDVTAYAKMQRRMQLTPDELRAAQELEKVANEMDAVLVYDQEAGFQWRSRRRTDSSILATD